MCKIKHKLSAVFMGGYICGFSGLKVKKNVTSSLWNRGQPPFFCQELMNLCDNIILLLSYNQEPLVGREGGWSSNS